MPLLMLLTGCSYIAEEGGTDPHPDTCWEGWCDCSIQVEGADPRGAPALLMDTGGGPSSVELSLGQDGSYRRQLPDCLGSVLLYENGT